VLLFLPDEKIQRAGKQRIVHGPRVLLPAHEEPLPSRSFSELKLLDGPSDGAALILGELISRTAGDMQSSHATQ